jgi:hypothetical protein
LLNTCYKIFSTIFNEKLKSVLVTIFYYNILHSLCLLLETSDREKNSLIWKFTLRLWTMKMYSKTSSDKIF